MKTTEEILKKYENNTDHWADQEYYKEEIQKAMIEYAKEVIDEIVSLGDDKAHGFIYCADTPYTEALYNYERIEEFKKNLK